MNIKVPQVLLILALSVSWIVSTSYAYALALGGSQTLRTIASSSPDSDDDDLIGAGTITSSVSTGAGSANAVAKLSVGGGAVVVGTNDIPGIPGGQNAYSQVKYALDTSGGPSPVTVFVTWAVSEVSTSVFSNNQILVGVSGSYELRSGGTEFIFDLTARSGASGAIVWGNGEPPAGEDPNNPSSYQECVAEPLCEDDESDDPSNVAGTRLVSPVQGDRGFADFLYVGPPEAAPDNSSDLRSVTAYKITTNNLPIAGFELPFTLSGGDSSLQVEINDTVIPLAAGDSVDFTTIDVAGITSFVLSGIDESEAISPLDFAPFVTGFQFTEEGLGDVSILPHTIVSDPGDFDVDGDVDGADFLDWQRNDGTGAGLEAWESSYAANNSSPFQTIQHVPEPGTCSYALLSLCTFAGVRRVF